MQGNQWTGTVPTASLASVRLVALAILAAWHGACGGSAGPTVPTSVVPAVAPSPAGPAPLVVVRRATCSSWPGDTVPLPDWPRPSRDPAACSGNTPPRFEDVEVTRRDAGIQITGNIVDPDGETVCDIVYFDERMYSGGWGGAGPTLTASPFVTLPVSLRLVTWDARGCVGEAVCLDVS